jgi:hypothetical protein
MIGSEFLLLFIAENRRWVGIHLTVFCGAFFGNHLLLSLGIFGDSLNYFLQDGEHVVATLGRFGVAFVED